MVKYFIKLYFWLTNRTRAIHKSVNAFCLVENHAFLIRWFLTSLTMIFTRETHLFHLQQSFSHLTNWVMEKWSALANSSNFFAILADLMQCETFVPAWFTSFWATFTDSTLQLFSQSFHKFRRHFCKFKQPGSNKWKFKITYWDNVVKVYNSECIQCSSCFLMVIQEVCFVVLASINWYLKLSNPIDEHFPVAMIVSKLSSIEATSPK